MEQKHACLQSYSHLRLQAVETSGALSGTPVSGIVSHGDLDLQLSASHKSGSCPDVADLSRGFPAFTGKRALKMKKCPLPFEAPCSLSSGASVGAISLTSSPQNPLLFPCSGAKKVSTSGAMLPVCLVFRVASQCMAWLHCVPSPRTRGTNLSGRVRMGISHAVWGMWAIEARLGAWGVGFEPTGANRGY